MLVAVVHTEYDNHEWNLLQNIMIKNDYLRDTIDCSTDSTVKSAIQ